MNDLQTILLTRFKTLLINFIDELLNWMPNDEELLTTRILVDTQIPMTVLIEKFAEHLLPFKEKIAKRDERFFLDDPQVFGSVKDQNRILSLKSLWLNPEFTQNDKNNTWRWMDLFVQCVVKYQQIS